MVGLTVKVPDEHQVLCECCGREIPRKEQDAGYEKVCKTCATVVRKTHARVMKGVAKR